MELYQRLMTLLQRRFRTGWMKHELAFPVSWEQALPTDKRMKFHAFTLRFVSCWRMLWSIT